MHLEVLLHVLTDHFEFALLDVGKLVKDKMGVESAEVVEEHGDLVIDRPLEITLLMSSGNEPSRNVVEITHFGSARNLVAVERLAANVAVSRILKLLLLSARNPFNWDIVF